jgi:hypothetical protein
MRGYELDSAGLSVERFCEDFNEPLKVKQSRYTPWRRLGGRRGIAPTHSRPRHLMGVSGQRHAPAALLPPGKGPLVPIGQEAGWALEPVWTQRIEEKSFAPAGDRTPIVRSSSNEPLGPLKDDQLSDSSSRTLLRGDN